MKPATLKRLEALEVAHAARETIPFNPESGTFPAQRPFVMSSAKLSTADCSRRAGKTEGIARKLAATAEARPESVGLYLTSTRVNAKRILWRPLKKLIRDEKLAADPNESELCINWKNGHVTYLAGAHHLDEVEKYRGMALAIVCIDEAQLFPSDHMETLLDDVLGPALMDYDGKVVLAGTPAPVPAGYFYDCCHGKYAGAWEHHSWTVFDNPWIERKSKKTPQQHLDAELLRRGVKVDDPKIQREWFGKWAFDPSSLVFKYNPENNRYAVLPETHFEWSYVLGVDLGFDDADAVAVLGWHEHSSVLYLIEEHCLPKQTISDLGNKLQTLINKYNPLKVVVDTGGLGKKITEELTQRWGMALEAAEKTRKNEHIELLNDAMTGKRLQAKSNSRFAQDCSLVEWDKSNPEKWEISERYHSDICDAVLYAYRSAMHWVEEPASEGSGKPGTPEWHEQQRLATQREIEARWEQEDAHLAQEKSERREYGESERDMW